MTAVRSSLIALLACALLAPTAGFVQGAGSAPQPRARALRRVQALPSDDLGDLPNASEGAASSSRSWLASVFTLAASFGLVAGLVAPSANAITAEQFSQLTYRQVKGSGLANRCPTVESQGTQVAIPSGARMKNFCIEPKSFAVEAETDPGVKEFVPTKLTTRQTYTLAFINGQLSSNPVTFKEEEGIDFAPVTVKMPDGEYVPFLFSVKNLVAKGEGSAFKPGFTWGGEFEVPSYRTGGFLDPKTRGMYLGYDQAVALPALQADGKEGQEELFKETNKVFDIGKGAVEMEVNKVNEELGEIGGVFVLKQPSDTDMGAKAPKTVLMKGIFYGKVV